MSEESDKTDNSRVLMSKKIIAWKLFQFVVFIVCVTGFTLQAKNFFTHFFTYPTIISTEVRNIEELERPAYTFCYTSQFKRTKYCKAYPDHCMTPENMTEFCKEKWYYCRRDTDKENFKIPKPEYLNYENYVRRNNTKELCQDVPPIVNETNGIQVHYIQTRSKFGKSRFLVYPCFSKHLRLEGHSPASVANLKKRTSVSMEYLTIDAGQDEMFDSSARPGILFALHSPYEPVNPYLKGALMKPGRSYQVHIQLKEENRLKYPYKTDCMNYLEIWEANNRTGPRSKEMCIQHCQIEYSMWCRKCEWGIFMYKDVEKMCEMDKGKKCHIMNGTQKERYAERQRCIDSCKTECVKRTYSFSVEERTNIPTVDDKEGKDYIDVDVFLDEPEIFVYSHKPQYMDVEAFSYIGGFMGCWLGISIWAFAHNIGNVLSSVVAYVKKGCRRKTEESSPSALSI
ncbi:hypothetical protein JTE90_016494 [Oedothorax gibbosus]|uniref:Uncharacterized protein n=1 Tax=Oedothorax gibbosus TaxID=931172 RepID=A0AAV6U8N4_9ARAC|nr:hypothetical protein JTE90_016494 [Oedothorax gibbosus]